MLGEAKPEEIASAALQEDVDVVGLNVGGHLAIVERVLEALVAAGVEAPVMAGGVLPPQAVRVLEQRGVACFPPGSSFEQIVDVADRLVAERVARRQADP